MGKVTYLLEQVGRDPTPRRGRTHHGVNTK
jgi:hypothetical protein